ncbi:MAG: hypothetical protein ACRBF0_19310 [Calditrichia bacterium]
MKTKLFAVLAIGMLALGSLAIGASSNDTVSEDCPLGCCSPTECVDTASECN